jgi:biopolymer transport protein ExbB
MLSMIFLLETAAELPYMDLILKGGIMMIPLLLLSLIAVFIFFDRFFYLRGQKRLEPVFFDKLNELIRAGKVDAAISLCESANSSESRILMKGLQNLGRPIREIQDRMEMEGKLEVYNYEGNLYYLGVIASIAPMLGFIGTIIGVIKIFYNISLADNISISLISGGLYEKLIASGVGLMIGIISYAAYHFLNNRINKLVQNWEFRCVRFVDLINK